MSANDLKCLQQAVNGDADVLSALLQRYAPEVRKSLRGRIDKRWQALLTEDDIMQETYAEAFLSIGRFAPSSEDPAGSFVRWLSRIARNNLLDAVKALKAAKAGGQLRQVQPQYDPNESYLNLCEVLGLTTTTPSRVAAGKEAQQALDQQILQLPTGYQSVIRLYDLEGRTAEQAAEQLECSVGAMYMRRARAHDMLRGLLQGPGGLRASDLD